jgi:hypothetical protein
MSKIFGVATRKNILIGGDFGTNPWQRGTSFPNVGTYCADRWAAYRIGGGPGLTASRQSVAFGDGPPTSHSIRLQRDSGQTYLSECQISQCLESRDSAPYAGKYVTFSFWAKKGANFSGSFNSRIYTGSGTDQRFIAAWSPISYYLKVHTLTTSWQKFSQTVKLDANTNQITCIFSTGDFVGTAGAADYIEVALAQLEEGHQASEFEWIHQAEVLQQCYRYYETNGFTPGVSTTPGYTVIQNRMSILAYQAVDVLYNTEFTVYKRANPTVVLWDYTGVYPDTVTGFQTANRIGSYAAYIHKRGFSYIRIDTQSPTVINLNDAIGYRWTAEADI